MNDAAHIAPFNRALLRKRRTRLHGKFAEADFLYNEITTRLSERLEDISRTFATAAVLGARGAVPPLANVDRVFHTDMTAHPGANLVCDEDMLPIKPASLDLIFSPMALHWVNDLPGALIQMRQALKPDGLLLAAFPGGNTLHELRHCLLQAEAALTGGAAPHIVPFIDLRDAGSLLQRAGFALPVTDADRINVTYRNPMRLLHDLRLMGEGNAMAAAPQKPLRRDVLMEAMRLYQAEFANADGTVPATFEIVYLTGWAPHPDQPKPLRPGSAKARLADALGVPEISAGEKPGEG
ncbi:MAG: methyltransferase domain-containing protein [Alphaproteobacteria bacterium]